VSPKASSPVALLWGEDVFLLRERALERLGDQRITEVDAAEWHGVELQDLATPSLFGERRALLISNARALGKEAAAALASYLAAPDPDATLVICAQVAERGKVPAALERLVKPVGTVTQVAIPRKELEPWLVSRARALGIDLAMPAARSLVASIGEEPGQLAASVEQLASAFPGERITPQAVAQQFRGLGDQRVWDLCDRAFSRDLAGAVRSLESIQASGDESIKTLGGIASRVRDLIRVRALPERTPPAQVAREAGLRFDWQGRRYRQQAGNYSMGRLLQLHERIVDADRALKSGATGDVVMPTLIVEIAAG
jgi:DNA polymerase III subunit delta